jgi:hypothetical protein
MGSHFCHPEPVLKDIVVVPFFVILSLCRTPSLMLKDDGTGVLLHHSNISPKDIVPVLDFCILSW